MSEVKVNKLSPRSGTTVTLGDSGDTITIPSGVTLANSGTIDNLNASNLTSGTVPDGRITGAYTGITNLTMSGDLNAGNNVKFGLADANNTILEIGQGATGNKYSLTDYVGDTTYTDFGLRIGRNNTGANTDSLIIHRGTGALGLNAQDAGVIQFKTSNVERMRIDSSGNVGIGTSSPSRNLHINASQPYLQLTSDATGTGTLDGFQLICSQSDGEAILMQRENAPTTFYTNNSERMRIDGSGNVGIGETVPLGKLHVKSADSGGTPNTQYDELVLEQNGNNCGMTILCNSPGDGAIYFGDSADNDIGGIAYSHFDNKMFFKVNGSERMRIHSFGTISFLTTASSVAQGDVGICIMSDGELLTARDVGGGSTVTKFNGFAGRFQTMGDGDAENTNNSYGAISDRTLKENETSANSQWNDIKALEIKNYNLIEFPNRPQLGVIAQDLETSGMNGLVKTNDEGIKSVKYSVLYMKAVKALQEAMERIETLEAKVQTLENNNP